MKLAVVYNLGDSKLLPSAYSWSYRDMLLAVFERFAPVQRVTKDCDASEIDADAILFYDVHSSHHIVIDGIDTHPAVKIEYFNDPHQCEQRGVYKSTGQKFHKLGSAQRLERAKRRGVQYAICPYRNGWERYLASHAGDIEFLWFPVAPANRRKSPAGLYARLPQILGNGHVWPGKNGFRPYKFRRWAFEQEKVTMVNHAILNGSPRGPNYQAWLSQYAGALALCDAYVVPKYLEIPLAGCVCFCQMHNEYAEMGFRDKVNCIAVDKANFNNKVSAFLAEPQSYQHVAEAGRKLAVENYTARNFAEFLWNKLSKK